MKFAFRAVGVVLAAIILAAMAWASTAPLSIAATDQAIVRLSLGARPERIETCSTQSDEALAKVAPQMRQRVVCEGVTARYRLEVRRNGELLHSQLVRGGGLRHDRRLYVSRELIVPPGPAAFEVHLVRIDTVATQQEAERSDRDEAEEEEGGMPGRERREAEERRRRREEGVPAELHLALQATLAAREVLLVSYDPEGRRLIARRGDANAP